MSGFLNAILGGGNKDESNNDSNNENNENNNKQTNQSNNNNNDNNENNIDNSADIWQNKPNDQNNDQNVQNQNQQNANNEQQIDPQEAMQNHIKSLNLTDGLDLGSIQEDLQNGNTESLTNAFEKVAANAYTQSLTQMNKIMDTKLAAVKDEATQQANASMNADNAVREMTTSLPFTSDPNIAPVAKAALNQLMKNGDDLPTAIQGVANFFKSTAEKINGSSTPPSNVNGGNFNENNNSNNSNNNNNASPSTHEDFLDLLSASN